MLAPEDYLLLSRIDADGSCDPDALTEVEVARVERLIDRGMLDYDCLITLSGLDALSEYEHRARQARELRSLDLRRLEAAEASAESVERIRRELYQTRKELAEYKAQQYEQHRAEAHDRELELVKIRRHEYKLAAFTLALGFLIEHIPDIVNLVKLL